MGKYDNTPIQITGSNVQLAIGETTTGLKTSNQAPPGWSSTLRLNIWGTATSFDVQIQAQMYDGQWRTISASNAITGASVGNDVTSAGVYDFDVAAFQFVALNVVSVTGGNVNAKGAFLP